MIQAHVTPCEIQIESSIDQKDRLKALPGARWDRSLKRWCFPATPNAGEQLAEAFPEIEGPLQPVIAPANIIPPFFAPMPNLKTKMWHHQKKAYANAYRPPATMLAMEMRTGKTLVSIALAEAWQCKRVLVACPLSVVGVWIAEVGKHSKQKWEFSRLDRSSVKGKAKKVEESLSYLSKLREPPLYMVVINHESVWREPFRTLALTLPWDLAIIDEGHRAKAPGGKFSFFLRSLANVVPRRLILTGTPMPHSPFDIYAQYRFLDRSIYGNSFSHFKTRYAVMGGFEGHEVKDWQNMDEFSEKFHRIAIEVKASEAFDLPDEVNTVRTALLEPSAQKIYDSMEKHFWAEVESGEITASNALVKLLRLQQCTSGFAKTDIEETDTEEIKIISNAKIKLLRDVLEDFPTDEPLVIFVRFTRDIERVRELCLGLKRTCGEISGQQKDLNDDGTFPENLDTLVVQIQAGSLGINLARASTAIFYSWGWSLGDVEQARARIRHGEKTEKLHYIHLVMEHTLDGRMLSCLENRRDFIADVIAKRRTQ